MGDPRSLKAYQISERLALDCISKYIKCCCSSTGYLICYMLQQGRNVNSQGRWWESSLYITALGVWLVFSPMLLLLRVITQSTQTRAICASGHTVLPFLKHSLCSPRTPTWVGWICPQTGRCSLHLPNSRHYCCPSITLKFFSNFTFFLIPFFFPFIDFFTYRSFTDGRTHARQDFELKLNVACIWHVSALGNHLG